MIALRDRIRCRNDAANIATVEDEVRVRDQDDRGRGRDRLGGGDDDRGRRSHPMSQRTLRRSRTKLVYEIRMIIAEIATVSVEMMMIAVADRIRCRNDAANIATVENEARVRDQDDPRKGRDRLGGVEEDRGCISHPMS